MIFLPPRALLLLSPKTWYGAASFLADQGGVLGCNVQHLVGLWSVAATALLVSLVKLGLHVYLIRKRMLNPFSPRANGEKLSLNSGPRRLRRRRSSSESIDSSVNRRRVSLGQGKPVIESRRRGSITNGAHASVQDFGIYRKLAVVLSTCIPPFLVVFSAVVVKETAPVAHWIRSSLENRLDALPDATRVLSHLVDSGRVVRHTRYDLYLPPGYCAVKKQGGRRPPCNTHLTGKAKKFWSIWKRWRRKNTKAEGPILLPSLVFLPGALVDHASYSPVMARLSAEGVLVVVMSMEPLRRPWQGLGADSGDVVSVMEDVSSAVILADGSICNDEISGDLGKCWKLDWSIGGHSMGSYSAMWLVRGGSVSNATRLVIWAGGKFDAFVPNLSDLTSLEVLTVQATEDGIGGFTSQKEKERFLLKMPSTTILRTINGGNHAGFASYPTTPGDGVRTISREQQQQQLSSFTQKFLLKTR